MSDPIVHEISYWSVDLDLHHGEPPEEQLRFALRQIFMGMARRLEHSDFSKDEWFPTHSIAFPLRMTLTCEELLWDFTLKLKLESETTKNFLGIIKPDEKD